VCGIYGVVSLDGTPIPHPDAAHGMAAALAHRGPDGHGEYRAPDATIGVERLRIVDLDPRADQPFTDGRCRAVVACNGEIYNADALRRRFRAFAFRSGNDAETILPLVLERGADGVTDLDGMFALAVWEPNARRLTLARDRAGEKPLFYARQGNVVSFASEIGALLEHPMVHRTLDCVALDGYLRDGYVSQPRTLFADVRQVPPAHICIFDREHTGVHPFWRPESVDVSDAPPNTVKLSQLIEQAVAKQVTADVPIGVFTSGGLDSSILACLAARHLGPHRVHTFAVGFASRSFDERPFARHLSTTLGTPFTEVEASERDLVDALDRLAGSGEPIADPAALPTVLLAAEAKRRVTVVLSGEGADELFGGYPTYVGHRLAARYAGLPEPLRRAATHFAALLPSSTGSVPVEYLLKRFVAHAASPWAVRHRAWFGTGLANDLLAGAPVVEEPPADAPGIDPVTEAMRWDYRHALPDRLLVKVDRATMLSGIEARAPFLDRHVTDAALAIAGRYHVRGLRTKCVLRRVARAWVPDIILRRRKHGLSVPVPLLLNGPLAHRVDGMMAAFERVTLFDGPAIAALVRRHRQGDFTHARGLWALLVLHLWMERWAPEVLR